MSRRSTLKDTVHPHGLWRQVNNVSQPRAGAVPTAAQPRIPISSSHPGLTYCLGNGLEPFSTSHLPFPHPQTSGRRPTIQSRNHPLQDPSPTTHTLQGAPRKAAHRGRREIQKQHLLRSHEQGLKDAVHVACVAQID